MPVAREGGQAPSPSQSAVASPQRGIGSIGAKLSIKSPNPPLQVHSQEPLLEPRLKPQSLVQPSPGTGTEKAPQARKTELYPCPAPMPEHDCSKPTRTTSQKPP